MGAFGFQNAKKIASSHQTKFQRPSAIIISSENIPATATLRRVTFHRGPQRKFVTKAAASVLVDAACILILRMRSSGLALRQFARETEICSTSTKRLLAKMPK